MTEIGGIHFSEGATVKSSISLPLEIEDISAEFLTKALAQKFPGVVVNNFEIINIRHGFTTIVRLDLQLNETGLKQGVPSRLILKGGFEEATRGKARDFAISPFLMETGSYREMKPALGLNMPTCYFAEVDLQQKQMIILMEDLALRNVNFCHGLKTLGPEKVKRRLTALAEFHARTWGDAQLEPGGRWEIFPANGCSMFHGYMHHVGYAKKEEWQKYVDAPRGAACSPQFHDVDWVLGALEYDIALSSTVPNCLVHGDLHGGNLYEDADGTPGFFDSLPRREAPMIEVSYFITNVMDPALRRQHDRDLVGHYRSELARHGVDVPDLDEMLRQFAAFLPYGYVTFMVNENTYQTESFNTAHTHRYSVAMIDHDTRGVIEEAKLTPLK